MQFMSAHEKLNFIRSEFNLGRNPGSSKNTVDFSKEDEILNAFDPGKIVRITEKQREFLLEHLKEKRRDTIVDDDYITRQGSLATSQMSRGSVSTHHGGSLHIAGFGEAHNFLYDEDGSGKYQVNNLNGSNSLMDSENNNWKPGRSMSEGNLDDSRDSNGVPLTTEQKKSRIQEKMKKKLE